MRVLCIWSMQRCWLWPTARSLRSREGENGGKWLLYEKQLEEPRVCNPSSGMSRGCALPSWRDALHWDSLREKSVRFSARCWHSTYTNYLKYINAMPEECFVIAVIAVFSKLTFVTGVDRNHCRLSYLWEKFYLSEAPDIHEHSRCWEHQLASGFQSPEQNDLAFCAQDSITELPLGSDFYKRCQNWSSRVRISISAKIQIRFWICSFPHWRRFLMVWEGGQSTLVKCFYWNLKAIISEFPFP